MDSMEYVIKSDGTVTRRCISELNIEVPDSALAPLTKRSAVGSLNLMTLQGYGVASANVASDGSSAVWTVPIKEVLIRGGFKLVDGIMLPHFAKKDTVDVNQMEMLWTAPMPLFLVPMLSWNTRKSRWSAPKLYFWARDTRGGYYKLPLPNIFDDGSVCEGREIGFFPTQLEAVMDALNTFRNSIWNADLWNMVEESQRMFRFKPTNDGFQQLPMDANTWVNLCVKSVNTEIQSKILLPLGV